MKLTWDKIGERLYETGVDRGVLYPLSEGTYQTGIAWNGLTSVNETPEGGEPTTIYADNIKYLSLMSAEDLKLSIEAYTYPDEFASCDGSAEIATGVMIGQQTRQHFGICYRTLVGNDEESTDHGYKIHLVYNCLASPTEKGYSTVNDSPEAITFSWSITTTPVSVSGYKPSASLVIDSTKIDATKLKKLEDVLYGTADKEPTLPLPDEVITLLTATA